jgi:hypothetical protein
MKVKIFFVLILLIVSSFSDTRLAIESSAQNFFSFFKKKLAGQTKKWPPGPSDLRWGWDLGPGVVFHSFFKTGRSISSKEREMDHKKKLESVRRWDWTGVWSMACFFGSRPGSGLPDGLFSCFFGSRPGSGLPDGLFSYQKSQFGYISEDLET